MANEDQNALLLQVAYDLRALERQNARLNAAVARGATQAEGNLRRLGAGVPTTGLNNLNRALDGVFNNARNNVMSQGAARIGVFGSALEALGPAGLIAAGAVGVFTAAVTQAINTARWAEQLGDTAQALRLTTTQVQELDFAAVHAGIPIESMRTTIQNLNQALGGAQAGGRMGRRTQMVFDALGINAETIRNTQNVADLLPLLADGFQRLARTAPAEAATLAQRIGIDSEVLQELEQGRGRIDELIQSAHRFGIVLDEEMVAKAARAQDALHELSAVMDAELRTAVADMTPMIEATARNLADAAIGAGRFAQQVSDAAAGVLDLANALANLHLPTMDGNMGDVANRGLRIAGIATRIGNAVLTGGASEYVPRALGAAAAQGRANRTAEEIAAQEEREMRSIRNPDSWHPTRATQLFSSTARGARGASSRRGRGAAGSRTRSSGMGGWTVIQNADGSLSYAYVGGDGSRSSAAGFTPGFAITPGEVTGRTVDMNNLPPFEMDPRIPGNSVRMGPSVEEVAAPFLAAQERVREQIRSSVRGGLEAAIQGGWPGLARYMAEQLRTRLLDALTDTITNLIQQAMQGSSNGSGGIGSWISAGLNALSGGGGAPPVPKFASGTPGGMALVGEFGPELVNLPKGADVIAAHATRALMAGRAGRGGGAPTFYIDARGSIGAEDIFAAIHASGAQAKAYAAQASFTAFTAARSQIPQDMSRRARRRL